MDSPGFSAVKGTYSLMEHESGTISLLNTGKNARSISPLTHLMICEIILNRYN